MTDDTVTAKLAEWEALVEGATPGPWVWTVTPDRKWNEVRSPSEDEAQQAEARPVARLADDPSAEFIAAAPTIARALLGFVREVRVALAHEACADTCGSQLNEVYPCSCWKSTLERALTERIGGEG